MDKDEYGHYVNDEGFEIKVSTDKNGVLSLEEQFAKLPLTKGKVKKFKLRKNN